MGINEEFPVASWQPDGGGDAVTFSVSRIEETGGNRIVPRERVYRDGAKLDDTGSKADGWTLTCLFFNHNTEPGVPGDAMYPDQLDTLIASCRVHATGTLTVPTVGPKRARAEHWTRVDDTQPREYAVLSITFLADNEDNQTASSFAAPSAASSAITFANDSFEDSAFEGVVSADSLSLLQLANQLAALASAPAEFASDLHEQANALLGAIDRIELGFQDSASAFETGGYLLAPTATGANTSRRQLADVAGRARATTATTRTVRYPRVISLLDVASAVQRDVSELLALNARYPDAGAIPARAPITVPA